jgi:hypothetical protein
MLQVMFCSSCSLRKCSLVHGFLGPSRAAGPPKACPGATPPSSAHPPRSALSCSPASTMPAMRGEYGSSTATTYGQLFPCIAQCPLPPGRSLSFPSTPMQELTGQYMAGVGAKYGCDYQAAPGCRHRTREGARRNRRLHAQPQPRSRTTANIDAAAADETAGLHCRAAKSARFRASLRRGPAWMGRSQIGQSMSPQGAFTAVKCVFTKTVNTQQ